MLSQVTLQGTGPATPAALAWPAHPSKPMPGTESRRGGAALMSAQTKEGALGLSFHTQCSVPPSSGQGSVSPSIRTAQ